jgi:hypothetical protein
MTVTLMHERFGRRYFIRHSSPLSHWERVGVRGYKLSIGATPHPALRATLSPWERASPCTAKHFRLTR